MLERRAGAHETKNDSVEEAHRNKDTGQPLQEVLDPTTTKSQLLSQLDGAAERAVVERAILRQWVPSTSRAA